MMQQIPELAKQGKEKEAMELSEKVSELSKQFVKA